MARSERATNGLALRIVEQRKEVAGLRANPIVVVIEPRQERLIQPALLFTVWNAFQRSAVVKLPTRASFFRSTDVSAY